MRSVSIIIPTYNVSRYVKECVLSVMSQTYEGPIECVIVDDCSMDDTCTTINELIEGYRGPIAFKMMCLPENKGVSVARNIGIMEARHEFVYFLDGDDLILPDCISKMMKRIEKYPDCQCVYAGFTSSETRFLWMDYTRKNIREYSNDRDWIRRAVLQRFLLTTSSCNRLVARQLILKNSVFFHPGIRYEDELWNFELSKHLQSIAVILENTYVYVSHPESFVHSIKAEERWERVLSLVHLLLERCSVSRNDRKYEIRSIMSIVDDQIYCVPMPRTIIGKIQKTMMKVALQATLIDAIHWLIYTTTLSLPSRFYKNHISRRLFKKWILIPI